jgi:hypothetical protein
MIGVTIPNLEQRRLTRETRVVPILNQISVVGVAEFIYGTKTISAHDQKYSAHQTIDRLLALQNLYMELRQ